MASRKVKMTLNNKYVQPLKLCFKNRHVLSPSSSYNSIVTKISHRACTDQDYKVKAWMRFNSNTFDGIQMIAGLQKGKRFKSIASCTFKIYAFSVDDLWSETLLVTANGSALPDGRFQATATESTLSPVSLDGEITFKLEVDIERSGKTYTDTYYFNHIGIYDSFIRLKQNVEFLDITKLDE